MKPLVIIPARGGSKGIPGKNIKLLNGKPLIHYSIDVARELFNDEQICVSTDEQAIKEVAEATGLVVPFLRPAELATDTATTTDVLLHALDWHQQQGYYADTVILLQPTSPLRLPIHVKEALDFYTTVAENTEMVVSVTATKSNPYYVLFEEDSEGLLQASKKATFTRRQDCPQVWEYNGSIYIIKAEALSNQKNLTFNRVRKYEMASGYSVDLDTPDDWNYCEWLIAQKNNK